MGLLNTDLSDINSTPTKEALNKWIATNLKKAKFNENVTIDGSSLGGFGIFYNRNNGEFQQQEEDADIELLRIPADYTLNIYNCLDHVDEMCQGDEESKDIVKRILGYYTAGRINETNIMISYVFGFYVLNKIGKLNNGNSFIPSYLNILLSTKVNNLHNEDPKILQEYYNSFKGNSIFKSVYKELESDELKEFCDYINEKLIGKKEGALVKVEELKQIIAAVRSRTLEIPREVEDEEDFVVDITLVPILDFANHDNSKLNAYFDVDKKTKEILLKLDVSSVKNSLDQYQHEDNKIEVFISYSKVEDINKFFFNYGFMPRSPKPVKLFEIPFWGYFDNFDNSNRKNEIVHKLRQSSNLQFILEYDDTMSLKEVKLNLLDNYSFLALIKSLELSNYCFLLGNEEEEKQSEAEPLSANVDTIIQDIMGSLSLGDINKAVYDLLSLVNTYFDELKDEIGKIQKNIGDSQNKEGSNARFYSYNLMDYLQFQAEVIDKFQELYQEKIVRYTKNGKEEDDYEEAFQLVMDADECEEEWLMCRMYSE